MAENKSSKQYSERKLVVDSQDVFAVLSTGFGKSLI
jgi:superfamily II DNA helicase RecQ